MPLQLLVGHPGRRSSSSHPLWTQQPLQTRRAGKAAWKWLLTQPEPAKNTRRRNLAGRTRKLPGSREGAKAPRAAAPNVPPGRGPAAPAAPAAPGRCPHPPSGSATAGRPLPAPPGHGARPAPPLAAHLARGSRPPSLRALPPRGRPGLASPLRRPSRRLAPRRGGSPCGGARGLTPAWEAAAPPPGVPERGRRSPRRRRGRFPAAAGLRDSLSPRLPRNGERRPRCPRLLPPGGRPAEPPGPVLHPALPQAGRSAPRPPRAGARQRGGGRPPPEGGGGEGRERRCYRAHRHLRPAPRPPTRGSNGG